MMKIFNHSIVRYIGIGGAAVVADNGVFFIALNLVNLSLFLATAIALTTGFIISFTGNKLLVFAHKEYKRQSHSTRIQLGIYALLFGFNTLFTYLFVKTLSEALSVDEMAPKIISTALITLWNYIIYKKVIFRLEHRL